MSKRPPWPPIKERRGSPWPPVLAKKSPSNSPVRKLPYNSPDRVFVLEKALHNAINVERAGLGLSTLVFRDAVATVARGHSEDMLARNFFDHKAPPLTLFGRSITLMDRLGSGHIVTGLELEYVYGENLAMMEWTGKVLEDAAVIECFVPGWMNSPPHRENIANPTFTTSGMGVALQASADGRNTKVYATQVFEFRR